MKSMKTLLSLIHGDGRYVYCYTYFSLSNFFFKSILNYNIIDNESGGQGKELRSGSKTFMVFGAGIRQCSGAEFARLHMSIFLHHLVTTYDFSLSKDCEMIRVPGAHFLNGIYINISKCTE